jgi:hypothetical protein
MPIGIDPSPSPPLAANRMAELRSVLAQHDLEQLAEFDSCLDALPLGPEHLALARASAAYQDQRGWRARAQARFKELLHLYRGDPHAQVRLQLDLAEMGMRWSDLPQMQRCLDQARGDIIHLPNPELEAHLLRGEALLACLRGNLADAKTQMQQALDRFNQLEAWPGIALGLNGMSYVCLTGKQWEEAVS